MSRLARVVLARREEVADVRRRLEAAGASGSFFVCATPRTGSTMLTDVLAASGTVGLALEHFNQQALPPQARVRLGDFLVERAGKAHGTGIFGTKLIWYQLDPFLSRLRGLRGSRGLADGELVAAVFPDPRYLWITREDVVAQAVSWWRAKITRVWQDEDRPLAEAVFDFGEIDERVRLAREQNDGWRRWFQENGVEPLRLTYEQLVADPAAAARGALAYLGVAAPPGFAPAPRTRKQADALNEEWMRRYKELAGEP